MRSLRVLLLCALAACGERAVESATAGGQQLSATSLPNSYQGDAIRSLTPAEVSIPCPDSVPAGQQGDPIAEATRLEPMLAVVLDYATGFPDTFATYGLHWADGGDASVVVAFAGPIESHRRALAERVEFPDELVVCQAPTSQRQRAGIGKAIAEDFEDATAVSTGVTGVLTVQLPAGAEDDAADLRDRYGDAVAVSVGLLPYPAPPELDLCPPTPQGPSSTGALSVAIAETDVSVEIGEYTEVAVTITNTTSDTVVFGGGPPTALVTDADGQVLGGYGAAIEWPAAEVVIEPQGTATVSAFVTANSCAGRLGNHLPVGSYVLVVEFELRDGTTLVTPAVSLVMTD